MRSSSQWLEQPVLAKLSYSPERTVKARRKMSATFDWLSIPAEPRYGKLYLHPYMVLSQPPSTGETTDESDAAFERARRANEFLLQRQAQVDEDDFAVTRPAVEFDKAALGIGPEDTEVEQAVVLGE